MLVWLNGRFQDARTARVAATDRGLLHGDGVYDTWRTYDGVPFAVPAHIRRLTAATRMLGLPAPGAAAVWEQRTRALVTRNHLTDATIRLTITRGDAGDALVPSRPAPPTILLTLRTLPPDLDALQARGIAAVLLPFGRDAAAPWAGFKTIGHPSAVVGRMLAARKGAGEGLYVNVAGEVTEATTANVFVVVGDTVWTPPARGDVLGGVTRDLVLRLARAAGLTVREAALPLARVRAARELFVTASTVEVLPVVRLDGRQVGDGRAGPVTIRLQEAYRAAVQRQMSRAASATRRRNR
ncbi:MAG TPA: aminotransferase class IV [Candidatus Binatia bacterium]|nr:aminotransferase class IV [Candidatus Binatia bacterium]